MKRQRREYGSAIERLSTELSQLKAAAVQSASPGGSSSNRMSRFEDEDDEDGEDGEDGEDDVRVLEDDDPYATPATRRPSRPGGRAGGLRRTSTKGPKIRVMLGPSRTV